MTNGTTMNAALFEALREAGIDEGHAARVAKAVPTVDSVVTQAEFQTEIKDVRAAIPEPGSVADKALTDEKFDRVLAELAAIRAELKDIREEMKATDSKIDRVDERAIGDRKIFLIILGVLLAIGAGVFQLLLP